MTEAKLVELCRRGDRFAFQELYAQTSQRIFSLLVRMTHDLDVALDLAQETYCQAFTHMSGFDGRSSVGTWLYRIAINAALQFHRKKTPRTGPTAAIRERPESDGNGKLEARMDVETALGRLDADDRIILILRYQEGMDYRRIAEVLECPSGTVASRLNRARDRVRGLLSPGYDDLEETDGRSHQKIGRPIPAKR